MTIQSPFSQLETIYARVEIRLVRFVNKYDRVSAKTARNQSPKTELTKITAARMRS